VVGRAVTLVTSRMLQAGLEIPAEADPRLAKWSRVQARRLARLSPAQRAALVLERYPELRALPNCDWQRLSAAATFTVLFGVSSRHFAKLELTAMQGILASAGLEHTRRLDLSVRTILDALRIRYGIATPGAITLGMWEEWGRDTGSMGALAAPIRAYAAAINVHVSGYREHLSPADHDRLCHLFLPPPGELTIPARVVYEDNELDLPHQPGPNAVSIEDLCWTTKPVRLELMIWRPAEFAARWHSNSLAVTAPGSKDRVLAMASHYNWRRACKLSGPNATYGSRPRYFVEAHPSETMPWFMQPVARRNSGLRKGVAHLGADGYRRTVSHAGLGTPDYALARYLSSLSSSDRRHGRRTPPGVCFDPEATYRGVLFGTAIVTLMLTADARIHEILQIGVDRFVKPARMYVVKGPDGLPKRDSTTKKLITDVIVEQNLLPKGRKSADLRLRYDVSAARVHLREIDHGRAQDGPWRPGAGRRV
jgi:hypothetical protein